MKIYTKINTLYRRYKHLGDKCPNEKWRKFQNCIIMGNFSEHTCMIANGKVHLR